MVEKKNFDDEIETAEAAKKKQIRKLNDRLRQNGKDGLVTATSGINALDNQIQFEIFKRIKTFNEFNQTNDPRQEHDVGVVEFAGIRCLWQIDYYDRRDTTMTTQSPDKYNPEATIRVMTIMREEEYY